MLSLQVGSIRGRQKPRCQSRDPKYGKPHSQLKDGDLLSHPTTRPERGLTNPFRRSPRAEDFTHPRRSRTCPTCEAAREPVWKYPWFLSLCRLAPGNRKLTHDRTCVEFDAQPILCE